MAAGRFDAFWEHDLKPWDIAAGALMVLEAGGSICDFKGEPMVLETGDILAANPELQPLMLERLKAAG